MARGVLLNSSIVVPHLRHRLDLKQFVIADEWLYLPLIALGELYKGVFKSNRMEENRHLLDEFLQISVILYPTAETALHYAQISTELGRKGIPIPENDIWIAAMAVEYDMPLATRDAHFENVAGLRVLHW